MGISFCFDFYVYVVFVVVVLRTSVIVAYLKKQFSISNSMLYFILAALFYELF